MGTMHRCTRIALGTVTLIAMACTTGDEAASSDTARGSVAIDSGAGALSGGNMSGATTDLSKFAGKWQMRATPTSGRDTSATTYTLTATGDTTGWTITFPGRAAMPVHVKVDGDSVMVSTEPYPSVRRKGLTVRTNGVIRMQGDRLVGTSTAHFKTSLPDSVMQMRSEGTRMQ